jgi:phytoene dehydrogenase-like protein
LARALAVAVTSTGGEIRLGTEPRRILVENGTAVGVETNTGEVLSTNGFVASGLDPVQTFVDLLDPRDVPDRIRDRAAEFKFNLIAPLFGLNLYLSESPQYTAARTAPEINDALMVLIGLDEIEQYYKLIDAHENGRVPPNISWGATPSRFDPSQARPGGHTAFMWQKVPYRIDGDPGKWETQGQDHARRMLDHWQGYAPNLRDCVIDRFWRSPLDTERAFRNMRGGDLLVGALTDGQTGSNRPFVDAGRYRVARPDNLYLCGSSSHPGGNVTGLPGYNCAQVLLDDRALPWPRTAGPQTSHSRQLPEVGGRAGAGAGGSRAS